MLLLSDSCHDESAASILTLGVVRCSNTSLNRAAAAWLAVTHAQEDLTVATHPALTHRIVTECALWWRDVLVKSLCGALNRCNGKLADV